MTVPLQSLLACPSCTAALDSDDGDGFVCERCGHVYPVVDGVPIFAPRDHSAHGAFYETPEPRRYGRGAHKMSEQFDDPVRHFLASLPRSAVVVELGSGQGAFDGAHPGYVATDYSVWALRNYSTGSRISCDAAALPFKNGSIDAFFSIATLEHVPEPERVLAEIDRCLKPGGRALLFPAWYVRPWAAKGLAIRPFGELSWPDRVRKASIALRDRRPYQFLKVLPGRLLREVWLARGRSVLLDCGQLEPNLSEFITSDSDAYTSLDPHAVAAYFLSRGFEDLSRPRRIDRIFYAYEPLVVRKCPG